MPPYLWRKKPVGRSAGSPLLPSDDKLALAHAVTACGPEIQGVLHWEGWHVPADLQLQTSSIDAGEFKPAKSPAAGRLTLRLDRDVTIDIELGYTTEAGWYVSARGSQAFYEQLERAVPESQVLRHLTDPVPSADNAQGVELPGPAVKAKFWTDDRAYELEFDARPYLAHAPDRALTAILEVGFVGDQSTDWVAEYVADKGLDERLSEAFSYLGALQMARRKDPVGFECEVDREGYLRWMDAHRRPLLARMLCERADVSISQAEEDEVRGMWDWQRRATGDACDHSYETEEEAVLAAYEQLDLLQDALDGAL